MKRIVCVLFCLRALCSWSVRSVFAVQDLRSQTQPSGLRRSPGKLPRRRSHCFLSHWKFLAKGEPTRTWPIA